MKHDLAFPPRLLPAPEAAHYLGISESTLAKLALPRKRLLGKRLYDRLALDAYASSLPTEEEANPCDSIFGVNG